MARGHYSICMGFCHGTYLIPVVRCGVLQAPDAHLLPGDLPVGSFHPRCVGVSEGSGSLSWNCS